MKPILQAMADVCDVFWRPFPPLPLPEPPKPPTLAPYTVPRYQTPRCNVITVPDVEDLRAGRYRIDQLWALREIEQRERNEKRAATWKVLTKLFGVPS